MRRQSFSLQKAGQLQWLQCDTLANKNWLLHAFSTRVGGSSWLGRYRAGQLNLGFIDSDKKSNVKTNRERFLNAVGGKDISREDLSLYEWPLAELQQWVSFYEQYWEDRLEALRKYVETEQDSADSNDSQL